VSTPEVALLLEDLSQAPLLQVGDLPAAVDRHQWLADATAEQNEDVLCSLPVVEPPAADSAGDRFVQWALATIATHSRAIARLGGPPPSDLALLEAARLYQRLEPKCLARRPCLELLATHGGPEALRYLAELLVADPPLGEDAALALTPLFQRRDYDPGELFPRLLDAVGYLPLAAAVLDLANFVTREELVVTHPAADRAEQLADLLGQIAQRLETLQERARGSVNPASTTPQETPPDHEAVGHSLSLAVSLCDALALIGAERFIGKLNQVLELEHRRLRVEAAAALARLGDDEGRRRLLALAAEPIVRQRVLAYAEELGIDNEIDPAFRTPESLAQAELVAALAEPTRFGVPPDECELIDQQTMSWPSYEQPVDCFLFRFTYRRGESSYSNVAIAGPLTHAFTADLQDLPPADIYAAYAGWQAEHEDIYEQEVAQLSEQARVEVARLERRIHDAGYQSIRPLKLAWFFGERVLIATAERDRQAGVVVADSQHIDWRTMTGSRAPLGPDEAFAIYKGRRLLRAFNE